MLATEYIWKIKLQTAYKHKSATKNIESENTIIWIFSPGYFPFY